jgi:hypothetical protein
MQIATRKGIGNLAIAVSLELEGCGMERIATR